MPEKKPDPKPAPRNRQERRKRAAEERKALKWTRTLPVRSVKQWGDPRDQLVYPHDHGASETISSGKVRGPDGTTWEVVGESPLDETKVVVPGEDGKPKLRPYQRRTMDDALKSDSFIVGGPCKPTFEVVSHDRPANTITEISLVTITPEIVGKVAERTGRTVDEVNAYLAGPEQDAALLGAFLFFGVGPVGKLPPSRLGGKAPISGPSEPGHGSFDGLTMP